MQQIANLIFILLLSASTGIWGIVTQIRQQSEPERAMLEMTKSHGYPVWKKFIDTPDGYILQIFRIPGPQGESLSQAMINAQTREPVLMLHGIMSSSEGFVINGPKIAPAYQLVDTGRYDVWLLNVRGNSYSKNHNFYEAISDYEYWDFSFEQMGDIDLPTAIDYILRVTNKAQLSLVGFSQGTTIGLYSLINQKARLQGKIRTFLTLAPVITMKYSTQDFLKQMSYNTAVPFLLEQGGYLEVFSQSQSSSFQTIGSLCTVLPSICTSTLGIFADTRMDLVNPDKISVYFQRFTAGTSLNNLVHMGQILTSGKFQRFDYGMVGNFGKYGSTTPLELDISTIDIPIAMFVGKFDTLATPQDNAENKLKIKNLVHYKEYDLDHLAFILAANMTYFQDAVNLLDKQVYNMM